MDGATRLVRLAAWESTFTDPAFSVGTWGGGQRGADGVISMPFFEYSEAVLQFIREMYEVEWVYSFDWMAWAGSAEGQRLASSPDTIATASASELAKVLTTILRSDRFSEGAIAAAFENGFIVAIVRRAAVLAAEPR